MDEDEQVAKQVEPDQPPSKSGTLYRHGERRPVLVIDSARVLEEVRSKRAILDECAFWYGRVLDSGRPDAIPQPDLGGRFEVSMAVLCALALPYAGRPGFREEWRH